MLSKWDFMHFIATFCFEVTDSAFNTSEKVPSPSLRTNLYSAELDDQGMTLTMHV